MVHRAYLRIHTIKYLGNHQSNTMTTSRTHGQICHAHGAFKPLMTEINHSQTCPRGGHGLVHSKNQTKLHSNQFSGSKFDPNHLRISSEIDEPNLNQL